MTSFVLDASVALGWILDNPAPALATRVKQELLAGKRATVPALWHLEIANALAVAERRKTLTEADIMIALQQIDQLVAHALDTDGDVVSVREALTTARAYRLSAYDSVYLDLARRTRLPLATLDAALRGAAGNSNVALLR